MGFYNFATSALNNKTKIEMFTLQYQKTNKSAQENHSTPPDKITVRNRRGINHKSNLQPKREIKNNFELQM